MPRGWYGEPGRHADAARGIKTAKLPLRVARLPSRVDRRPRTGTHLRAKNWAFDVLDEMEPDEVDERTRVIVGREYLITVEGWSEFCFMDVDKLDPRKDYDACDEYAASKSDEILREEWPRYWGPRGYRMIAGQFDAYTGEFGRVWALWIRSPGKYRFGRPVVRK